MLTREAVNFVDLACKKPSTTTIVLDPAGRTLVTDEQKIFQESTRFFSTIKESNGDLVAVVTRNGPAVPVVLDGNEIGTNSFYRVEAGGSYSHFGKNLSIVNYIAKCPSLTLRNCRILRLEIQNVSQDANLINCQIGILVLHGGEAVRSLHLEGCSVSELDFPKESKVREITFNRTSFSSRKENGINPKITEQIVNSLPKLDRASFAFLHEWASKSGNSRIAHLSRGYELSIERELSGGFEKFALNFWWFFGNFGLTPMLPVVHIIVLYFSFAAFLFCMGTELGSSPDVYQGWRSALVGETPDAARARAFVGAAEGIISPFSNFSVRRLVLPTSGVVAVVQVLYNYLCFVLLFMFGFSIRRRFKVS